MNGHQVAIWAGLSAFFGSLLTIAAIDVLKPDALVKFASSLVVAVITGGTVYTRERLADARKARGDRGSEGSEAAASPTEL